MFFVNLVGTMSFMVWRLMMMASMITSTGYLIPLLFSSSVDLFSAELYGPLQLAPAVAAVKTVEVKAAPVAAVAYAAPAVHVATAPVVHHVGYQVHHQVHHVPKVTVQKHTSTHTTHHVINHAPVIDAFSGVVPVAGVPVVAAVPAELYGPFQLAPPQHHCIAGVGAPYIGMKYQMC